VSLIHYPHRLSAFTLPAGHLRLQKDLVPSALHSSSLATLAQLEACAFIH